MSPGSPRSYDAGGFAGSYPQGHERSVTVEIHGMKLLMASKWEGQIQRQYKYLDDTSFRNTPRTFAGGGSRLPKLGPVTGSPRGVGGALCG
jgi:hypothetical protein